MTDGPGTGIAKGSAMGLFNRRNKAADVRPMVSVDRPTSPVAAPEPRKVVALPPVYCLTQDDVERGLDGIGAIQQAQDERMSNPYGAAQRMVALADGIAGYYLRRAGNRNLHSMVVEGLATWSMYTYAPVWLRGDSADGEDARAAYDLIREFADRYAFLEETEGRPVPGAELSPLPSTIENALLADGWHRGEFLLFRMFEAPDHYVQEVLLHPEDGGFELVVGLMELPAGEVPDWVAEEDRTAYSCTVVNSRVTLKDRVVDQRTPVEEISARAAALAQRGTDLEALYAELGDRQIRLTDPGSPEGSLDALAWQLLRACPFGVGLYGPGTVEEALAEFFRLSPNLAGSPVAPSGVALALGDSELPIVALTGPRGSLVAICQLGDRSVVDEAAHFGGRDVANGWSMMVVSRGGVTFGTVGQLLEGAQVVPLDELGVFTGDAR